jgi:membrane protease YdiL (CAAX protease family)
LGGLGPFLGAIVATYFFDRKQGVKVLFKNKLFAFPKAKWLVIGFGVAVLFFLIPYLSLGIFKGDWLNIFQLWLNSKLPDKNAFMVWLLWCFFYGIGEEGGWRGFLLPVNPKI